MATATAICDLDLLYEVNEFQLLIDHIELLAQIFILLGSVRIPIKHLKHLLDNHLNMYDLQLVNVKALQYVVECANVVQVEHVGVNLLLGDDLR